MTTNQLINYEEKMVVLMKSGLIHWVTGETGKKIGDHIANQSGHSFLRLKELDNITINTAEIEGVYNHKQYEDLCRVKSGEWQCAYGKWHLKKGECKCKEDKIKTDRMAEQQKEFTPMTEEERKQSRETMMRANEMAALNGPGMFRDMYRVGKPRKLRLKTIKEWENKNGRKADLEGLNVESI